GQNIKLRPTSKEPTTWITQLASGGRPIKSYRIRGYFEQAFLNLNRDPEDAMHTASPILLHLHHAHDAKLTSRRPTYGNIRASSRSSSKNAHAAIFQCLPPKDGSSTVPAHSHPVYHPGHTRRHIEGDRKPQSTHIYTAFATILRDA
ncbi:hypothetical protein LTS06_012361, partial [Exophiala xenobiotica]